ncbi:MAG TPA: extracellular solute-binding protein [Candidatus Limnocylindrales bacterium]
MNARKSLAITAVAAVAALGLAACSSNNTPAATTPAAAPTGGATTGAAAGTDSGTLTIWENNTTGTKGPAFWQTVKTNYAKIQPGVTLNIVPVQNEDLDGKLQTAMNGGTPPDVFLQRGGGKLADMVSAGYVADITSAVNAPDIPAGAFAADTLGGKKYAMPLTILPGGFFYAKDLFTQAGIATPPTTLDELNQAVTKLKGIGVAPIALGAQDAWPAAHWFYWLSLRECTQDALEKAATTANLSDPCFLKAGTDLQTFAATKPFNDGFLTTSAQKGAGSSAGLVANHKAAMELMGAWDPGVIGGLTPDQKNLPDLGFFPFVSVPGGAGDPTAMMAGVDGYSCSSKAPMPACSNFLNFLGTTEVQKAYADANSAPPANTAAASAVTDPVLQQVMGYSQKAAYVSLWLDTRLGQSIGNALNTGVVNMLAGNGTPQGIIDAANKAAAKG